MLGIISVGLLVYRCLPVRLVGGNEAGDIAQDSSAALDDGERVGVTAVCQRSHQEGQSTVHSTDVRLVLCTVSRQVPERAQYRLQSRLLGGVKTRCEDAQCRSL